MMVTQTITISDLNAGSFVCTNTTAPGNITCAIIENITLTN
jgi:hypothetical protein